MMTPAVVLIFLAVVGQTIGHFDKRTNIALRGKVAQSSVAHSGVPERATDGNRASKWHQKSCTHTTASNNPWWRLDLQKTFKIYTVTITNRKDCCHDRINGAEIRIGNSFNDHGNTNPRCTVISSIQGGATKTFACNGMEGRYVNVVIPGKGKILTLCEVEVTGIESDDSTKNDKRTNIALRGKVAQSSVAHSGVPERATDGNRASKWHQKSCTHTTTSNNPWWRLDLQKTFKIYTVTITNRKDCCHDRINGAEIRIGNSFNDHGNTNPRCTVISSIQAGATNTFACNGMEGRYVNVVIPGKGKILTLCEVEVTGIESDDSTKNEKRTNIALHGKVAQSSVYQPGYPERATDGNRASKWHQKSCTHTTTSNNPWWRLDLQKTFKIYTVTITNRKDCCHDRINGAEIRIGNSFNDHGNTNPRCTVISSIQAGATNTFACNGMEGRYVNVVIPGKGKILTLCEVEVTGIESDDSTKNDKRTNIALRGKVAQSSVAHSGVPERATDGNRASKWHQKSCTHTTTSNNPWWRLDLQKTFKIYTVTITNRKDCCHDRINGAEIRIGNSFNDHGNTNPRCTVISSIQAGATNTFACNGMEGRYVTVVIPGKRKILTLCEVEVTGIESDDSTKNDKITNIALHGKVAQSSVYQPGYPERATDGNRASKWHQKSCTHTTTSNNPWWRLDLQKTFKIYTVTITNRKDCCHDRINGAEIRIGNSFNDHGNTNPRCTVISSIQAGATNTFACNGMEGRYVNIVIPGKGKILTLCEVEVTGIESDDSTKNEKRTNIALHGKVAQSSVYQPGYPERATDGNRASKWHQKSCTHTTTSNNPWWRLDLQKTFKIYTVTITNRKDCCHDRINGAEIRIGNSFNDHGNTNPRCTVISSIQAGATNTFACNGMEGRYVNIVIPGKGKILTLCEVEVTGIESDDSTKNEKRTSIALSGKVAQSSVAHSGVPERATDGNRASKWHQKSCTHTTTSNNPWWRLDLQKTYKINTVTITNRKDCCHDRINGAEIRIGNSLNDNGNANPRCTVISSIQAGATNTFACNGMEGRYVNVVIPGKGKILTLCEVEVTRTVSNDWIEYACH